jgi:hypothetical protein
MCCNYYFANIEKIIQIMQKKKTFTTTEKSIAASNESSEGVIRWMINGNSPDPVDIWCRAVGLAWTLISRRKR